MFILHFIITNTFSTYIDGDLLEDDGSFSFEIAPPEWMRDRGQFELTDVFVMDNAGNISEIKFLFCFYSHILFEDADAGNEWNRFYTNVIDDDENEIYFNLDNVLTRNNGHIYFDDTIGAIANFTDEIITFEGISVDPRTIFNSNTSIFDIPDEVFVVTEFEKDLRFEGTLADDFIVIGSIDGLEKVQIYWSPGDDQINADEPMA